jgi:hypothetical protein
VRSNYGNVLEIMSHAGASILFRTRSNPFGTKVTNYQAGERLKAVKELGYPYGTLRITGRLIGGLIEKKGEFQIRVNDKLVYKGPVSESAIPKIESVHLGDQVVASFRVEQKNDTAEQTYLLMDINPAPSLV